MQSRRVALVLSLAILSAALAGCGRRGALEAPPGAEVVTEPAVPGSGGAVGPTPVTGPTAESLRTGGTPQSVVVGRPEPQIQKKPDRPFVLDKIL